MQIPDCFEIKSGVYPTLFKGNQKNCTEEE